MLIVKSLKEGLEKTRQGVLGQIARLIKGKKALSGSELRELEELLLLADVGPATAERLMKAVEKGGSDLTAVEALKAEMLSILSLKPKNRNWKAEIEAAAKPSVWLIAGVNGSGKTTSIGKISYILSQDGRRVMLAAADTYRAAAIEQLKLWAKRTKADFIGSQTGADPASVAYDALSAAQAQGTDVLLIDTAGRLHTQKHLRDELVKVRSTIAKKHPGSPHVTLLVLDATTGQNALSQARLFSEAVPVDGIILTKLDGTAKGGMVLAIAQELEIPVAFIGIGEGMEDLRFFDPQQFVESLMG